MSVLRCCFFFFWGVFGVCLLIVWMTILWCLTVCLLVTILCWCCLMFCLVFLNNGVWDVPCSNSFTLENMVSKVEKNNGIKHVEFVDLLPQLICIKYLFKCAKI